MKRHSVSATLHVPALTKETKGLSPLKLVIKDGIKIGELVIGRGAIYWAGRNGKILHRIPWRSFAEIMDNYVKGS